jgi:hypothetical protein
MDTTQLRADLKTIQEAAMLMALHQRIQEERDCNNTRYGKDFSAPVVSPLDRAKEFTKKHLVTKPISAANSVNDLIGHYDLAGKLPGFKFDDLLKGDNPVSQYARQFKGATLDRLGAIAGTFDIMTNHMSLAYKGRDTLAHASFSKKVLTFGLMGATSIAGLSSLGGLDMASMTPSTPVGAVAYGAAVAAGVLMLSYAALRGAANNVVTLPGAATDLRLARGQKLVEDRLNEILPKLPGNHSRSVRLKIEPTKEGGMRAMFYKGRKLDNEYGPALLELDREGAIKNVAYMIDGRPVSRPQPRNAARENDGTSLQEKLSDHFYTVARTKVQDGLKYEGRGTHLPKGTHLFDDLDAMGKALVRWIGTEFTNRDRLDILKVKVDLSSITADRGGDGQFTLKEPVPATIVERIRESIPNIVRETEDKLSGWENPSLGR